MEVREGVQPNYTGTLDVAERERSRKIQVHKKVNGAATICSGLVEDTV